MDAQESAGVLGRAQDLVVRGEWEEACELLLGADASRPLDPSGLMLLADVAYATGRLDLTIQALERAFSATMAAGDALASAGAAVRAAMHLLFDTALMAPVRGWLKRAEHLLEGLPETPVHGWFAVVRNYERLLSGDFKEARRWAAVAIDVGNRCDAAVAAIGRVAEARSLILEGDVAQGLALLNDAAVATSSGELDPLSTGIVYCELVCALQALAQYDLAEQWTLAMERWQRGKPVGSVHGRCRVHRAEILRLRGLTAEAEKEALAACEELRPYLRREFGWPLTELGRIRLQMGDTEGAKETFLAAHVAGWDPQPGLALVYLAEGNVSMASALIRDALDYPSNVPSKEWPPNTELRRAPLLAAQAEIEIAAGDLERARAAAEELARVALVFQSSALAATASLAAGRVRLAAGDAAGARHLLEEALRGWNEVGAPYEAASARISLGHAYRAQGMEQNALLEFGAARTEFLRIGAAGRAADAASAGGQALEQKPPVRAASATQVSAEGDEGNVFRREGDYWCIVFDGHTVRLRGVKGLSYLALLLAHGGQELHVLDLAARVGSGTIAGKDALPASVSSLPTTMAILDPEAKEAYRRRLLEIEEDLEEAHAMGDSERAAQSKAERDFLVRELAQAVGLGGRDRRLGSVSERARASVTRAIRSAMTRIQKHHPSLGEHLNHAIHTGTYCAYQPDPRRPTQWHT